MACCPFCKNEGLKLDGTCPACISRVDDIMGRAIVTRGESLKAMLVSFGEGKFISDLIAAALIGRDRRSKILTMLASMAGKKELLARLKNKEVLSMTEGNDLVVEAFKAVSKGTASWDDKII